MSESQYLYPEIEKVSASAHLTDAARDFIEYCSTRGIVLAAVAPHGELAAILRVEQLLCDWQGIDAAKVEAETRALIAKARADQAAEDARAAVLSTLASGGPIDRTALTAKRVESLLNSGAAEDIVTAIFGTADVAEARCSGCGRLYVHASLCKPRRPESAGAPVGLPAWCARLHRFVGEGVSEMGTAPLVPDGEMAGESVEDGAADFEDGFDGYGFGE